jgi:hypothetical protein
MTCMFCQVPALCEAMTRRQAVGQLAKVRSERCPFIRQPVRSTEFALAAPWWPARNARHLRWL